MAAAALAGSALFPAPSAPAGTLYWDGGTSSIGANGNGASAGGNGTWDTTLQNWDQGSGLAHVAWNAGSDALFAGTAGTVTLGAAVSVNNLAFNTNGYTLQGGTITLAASTVTLGANVSATISSVLAGTSLAAAGTGTLILSGANTYTGATTIQNGMLQLGNANALPGVTTVNFGGSGTAGTLNLAGYSPTVSGFGLGASAVWTNQLITNSASGTSAILTATGASTFGGAIQNGNGTVTLVYNPATSTATLTLSGLNTYTGGTSVQNGVLVLAAATNALASTGTVTLGAAATSGVLQLGTTTAAAQQTLAGLLTTGTGGSVVGGYTSVSTLTLNPSAALTFGGTLGGAGTNQNNLALAMGGTGTLALTGNNTYTGTTSVTNGILNIRSNNALGGTTGGTTVSSGATLQLQGNINVGAESLTLNGTGYTGQTGALVNVSGSNTFGGVITPSNPVTIAAASGSTLTLTGGDNTTFAALTLTGGTIIISGNPFVGSGSQLIIGDGTAGSVVNLNASNSYGAGTQIRNNATLYVTNSNALGATSNSVNVNAGGVLQLSNNISIGSSTNNPMSLNGTGISHGGALVNVSGANTYAGSITMGIDSTITSTAGTLTLTGGIAIANHALTINGGGSTILNTNGISGSGSGNGLYYSGSGCLILAASGDYTGGTTITGGTLLVNNSSGSATGTGAVTVTAGADNTTATLGGTGTLSGSVTISAPTGTGRTNRITGGTIGTVGTLTLSGGLNFAAGSVGYFDITSTTSHDYLNITGSLTAAGQTYLRVPTGLAAGTYSLIGYTGTASALSNFTLQDLTGAAAPSRDALAYGTKVLNLVVGNGSILALPGSTLTLNMRQGAATTPGSTTITNSSALDAGHFTPSSTGTNGLTLSPSGSTAVSAGGSATLTVGWSSTAATGSRSGQITIANSDDATDGGAHTQAVSGGVYAYANPGALASAISHDFGNVHQGSTQANATLGLSNSGESFTDNLGVSGVAGGSATAGNAQTLSGGATGTFTYGIDTTSSGHKSGSITLSYLSHPTASGLDDNHTVGSQVINVTATVYSGQGAWTGSSGGSWGDFGNWDAGGAPGTDANFATTDAATLGGTSGDVTVNLNTASPSLAGLTLNNSTHHYTIAQGTGGTLIFNNGGSGATLSVTGSHTISAPLALSDNLTLTTGALTDSLSISGLISGGGQGLTKAGSGVLTLGNTNTYSGGTTINAGTLVVDGSIANSAVTVNAGGTLAGTGTTGAVHIAGGTISSGHSPGVLRSSAAQTWSSGNCLWQVNQVTPSGGTQAGHEGLYFDQLAITGSLTINSGFVLSIDSLGAAVTDWNSTGHYEWIIATTTAGISGATGLTLDTTGFTAHNTVAGPGFSVSAQNGNLVLDYTGGTPAFSLSPTNVHLLLALTDPLHGGTTGTAAHGSTLLTNGGTASGSFTLGNLGGGNLGVASTIGGTLTAGGTQSVALSSTAGSNLTYGSAIGGTLTLTNTTTTMAQNVAVWANVGQGSISGAGGTHFNAANQLTADMVANGPLTGLSSTTIGDVGAVGTTAIFLAGSCTAATTASMNWRAATAAEKLAVPVVSDVVQIAFTDPTSGAPAASGVYVLEMTYDPAQLPVWVTPRQLVLGELVNTQWTLAAANDRGVTAPHEIFGAYNGSLILGDYGVDTADRYVWAVLDHSGTFAVIPEPASLSLLGLGALGLLARRRRARNRDMHRPFCARANLQKKAAARG